MRALAWCHNGYHDLPPDEVLRRFRLDYLLRVPQEREVRLRWSDIAGLVEPPEGKTKRTA